MSMKFCSLALALTFTACSSSQPAPLAQPPADEVMPPQPVAAPPVPVEEAPVQADATAEPAAPPIVVAPFKMVVTPKGKPAETIEVGADGIVKRSKDGKVVAKFVGNEVQDSAGSWLARVNADGSVELRTTFRDMKDGQLVKEEVKVEKVGSFVDQDALDGPKGKATIDDKGALSIAKPDGKTEAVKELKLEGVTSDTRRAGMLLFVAMMAGTVTTDTTNAEAKPAAPPATK